jgi:hypothetical protein
LSNFLGEHRWKNSYKILACLIKHKIINIIQHNEVGFIPGIQGWFTTCKSINILQHINRIRDKNLVIISTDVEKFPKSEERNAYPGMRNLQDIKQTWPKLNLSTVYYS